MTVSDLRDGPTPPGDLPTGSDLARATAIFLAFVPASLAPIIIDPRVLNGKALWLKPLMFQISMVVLCGTLVLAVALFVARAYLLSAERSCGCST